MKTTDVDNFDLRFDRRTLVADVFVWFPSRDAAMRYGQTQMLNAAKGPHRRMALVGLALALAEDAARIPGTLTAREAIAFQYRILVNTDETHDELAHRLRDQLAADERAARIEVGNCHPAEAEPAWAAARRAAASHRERPDRAGRRRGSS